MNIIKSIKKQVKKAQPQIVKHQIGEELFEIEVKQYLSANEKRAIIDMVVDSATITDEKTGLKKIDHLVAEVVKKYLMVAHYTNITVDENVFEMYDLLKQCGLIDKIIENCEEAIELEYAVQDAIREQQELFNRELSVGHVLVNLMEELNGSMESGLETIKNFDFENLGKLKEIVKHKEETKA